MKCGVERNKKGQQETKSMFTIRKMRQNSTSEKQRQVNVFGIVQSYSRVGHSSDDTGRRRIVGCTQTNPGF
ncbi:hypothetical protein TNCV_4971161 [Trichonephila clavipes]|nr:hypothetical protein TNCV_4971161 [Trichonephila clavipes]